MRGSSWTRLDPTWLPGLVSAPRPAAMSTMLAWAVEALRRVSECCRAKVMPGVPRSCLARAAALPAGMPAEPPLLSVSRRLQVRGPAMPSAGSFLAGWKERTAAVVAGPKTPSASIRAPEAFRSS